jgi:Integrase zinc binding domain
MLYREQARDQLCREVAERADRGVPGFGWTAEGLLYKDAEVGRQVLVPRALRQDVLPLAHLPPCGAHPGVKRMIQNVSRGVCWPSVARDCARYVSDCLSCSAVKPALTQKWATHLSYTLF